MGRWIAAADGFAPPAQVILGTESGMITAIVRRVQSMLQAAGRTDVDVEIVFPVAPDSITTPDQLRGTAGDGMPEQSPLLPGGLAIVPGPAAGEGCSTEGGCASCPYMKMNSLQYGPNVCLIREVVVAAHPWLDGLCIL